MANLEDFPPPSGQMPVNPIGVAQPSDPASPSLVAAAPAVLLNPEPTVVNTDSGKSDGLNKCPRCGSADVALQPGTGKLQCHYCRFVFDPPTLTGFMDARELVGETVGSGAADITQPDNTQITIKCQGCGAEVVVDVNETMYARCHWCRQMLSIENQIPNGAVPDIVLPFYLSREQARASIEGFVKKRTFFANPRFKREFTTENVVGVYLPYLVVDANLHSDLRGKAGNVVREYRVRRGKDNETVYDIDIYDIGRDYDLAISGLTVEASADKLNVNNRANTNNIINTILPFDIENAVPYSGNYLKGFNSERRDTNIEALKPLVDTQIRDVTRFQANSTAPYNGGIRWESENTAIKGTQWKSAYLPVWLYSYYEQRSGGRGLLHYVAVNARTGETMGSVPLNMPALLLVSSIVEVAAVAVLAGLALLLLL